MRIRRTALALAMVTAVTVPAVTTGVVAYAQANPSPAGSSLSAGKKSPAKSTKKPTTKPAKSPVKKVKATFTATGTVSAVNPANSTATIAAKAGTKDVKGKTVTISVPSSVKILLNGKKVQVSALAAGHKITVVGTRVDGLYTAVKVQATGRAKATPTAPATPEPSTSPTTPPSTSPTEIPSAQPVDSGEPEPIEAPQD